MWLVCRQTRIRDFLNFFQVVSNSAGSLDVSELLVRSFVLPPRTSQVLAPQHAGQKACTDSSLVCAIALSGNLSTLGIHVVKKCFTGSSTILVCPFRFEGHFQNSVWMFIDAYYLIYLSARSWKLEKIEIHVCRLTRRNAWVVYVLVRWYREAL